MQDHIRYHILKQVQDNPRITQRELAQSVGISLGRVNYCLHPETIQLLEERVQELIDKLKL